MGLDKHEEDLKQDFFNIVGNLKSESDLKYVTHLLEENLIPNEMKDSLKLLNNYNKDKRL